MSDSSQGPGWWQASDGKWYPPEQHPQAASTLPPPTRAPVPQAPIPSPPAITPFGSPGGQGKRSWWRRWWVIAIGVVIAVAIVAGIVGDEDQDEVADVPDSATTLVTDDDGTVGNAEVTTPTTEQSDPDDDLDQPAPPDTGDVGETADTVDDAAAGTRDDPYWIGEPVTITINSFGDGDGSVWTIVVDGPGTDVTREVREENPFNEPPPEDSIFYGVPVSLTLQGANKEPLSTLFNLELEFFGPATASIIDQGFDEGCGLAPGAIDPLKEVFVGGTLSGIVCLAVTEADVDAGVLLTTDSGDGDRIFFATSGDAVETGPITPDEDAPLPDIDAEAGSRSNPLPIGEPVTITLESFGDGDGSAWTIVVDGPGTDLTSAVAAENPFNEPPPDGSVFFGVPVTLTLEAADKEPLSTALELELEFFGPATLAIIDRGFDEGCGVTPGAIDPFTEIFVGGSISGVVCLAVTRADLEAGVLLTTDSGEADRIFFAT